MDATRSGIARKLHRLISSVFVDPLSLINKWRGIPFFMRNSIRYRRVATGDRFPLKYSDLYFMTGDRFQSAGNVGGHYFWQDYWAARWLFEKGVRYHVDVGSRLDGFITHIMVFSKVTYIDLRPLKCKMDGLEFVKGSILKLPFRDDEIESLSCLHVLEHIGLGRYGDPIDPTGYIRGARELQRVLKPSGTLILGVPVGRERLCFDAHRIFHPETIMEAFQGLHLQEFNLIDDEGDRILYGASFKEARQCEYGCGLFVFRKTP